MSDCERPFCRKLGTTDPAHRGGWPIRASMSWRTILPNACVMQTTDRLSQSASQNAIISSAWKAQQCQKITRPVAGRKSGLRSGGGGGVCVAVRLPRSTEGMPTEDVEDVRPPLQLVVRLTEDRRQRVLLAAAAEGRLPRELLRVQRLGRRLLRRLRRRFLRLLRRRRRLRLRRLAEPRLRPLPDRLAARRRRGVVARDPLLQKGRLEGRRDQQVAERAVRLQRNFLLEALVLLVGARLLEVRQPLEHPRELRPLPEALGDVVVPE